MFLKKLGVVLTCLFLLALASFSAAPASAVGSNIWNGVGDGYSWSDTANWDRDVSSGDWLVFDTAQADDGYSTMNDLSDIQLYSLTYSGDDAGLVTGVVGNALRLAGGINNESRSYISISTDILADLDLFMVSQGGGDLELAGVTKMGPRNLTLRSLNEDSWIIVSGSVAGSGSITITGDDYGTVYVIDGGSLYRPITVRDKGYLYGNGRVGSVRVAGTGDIEAEKCMTTNNLTIDGFLYFTIGGLKNCAGNKHSRINAKGKVDLTGGTLYSKYALKTGFVPAKGSQVILISNDGTDKVVGTFKNRPHGSKFKIGAYTYQISYRGGSGNDVVLARL